LRLVRNPRFVEWSHLAKPDGYPDEIDWTFGLSKEDQLDMIVAGTADAMAPQLPQADAALLKQLWLQYPAQAHASMIGTLFLHMNTTQAPFDDVRVRRAVSFAIDRGEIASLLGGEIQARPTCQTLAPHLPGYVPYCPYTINPDDTGNWTAPDLAAARDLVAAAAPVRKDITILASGRFVPVAQSIVHSLDQLGFEAATREPGDNGMLGDLLDPVRGPLVQAAVLPWLPDVRTTVDEVYPILSCGDPVNFTYLCDNSITASVNNALEVQQTNPAGARQAWATADRTIVDLAPSAPLVNIVYLDFVSAGVGNYQAHPQWATLYDQLWVK